MNRRLLLASALLPLALLACGGKDDGAATRSCGAASGSGSGSSAGGSSACSGSGAATPACGAESKATGAATTVQVTLNEWAISPAPASVPAGKVAFVARNRGKETHELVVLKGDAAKLPKDKNGAIPEAATKGRVSGEIENVTAGKSCASVFTLAAGSYTLLCNISQKESNGTVEAHLAMGMATPFQVSSAG